MTESELAHRAAIEFRIDETEHVRNARTIVIAVHGDTDMRVVDELAARLSEVIDEAPSALVLDLSGVTFLDSMALGVLLSGLKRLGESGGRLRVVIPRPEVRRIFEVTLLDRLFDIDASRDEALAATTSPA
ncbi:MAG: STAS domain-containing protein [Actinobacteria bacterium]|nr:STAS domain-containing protein [Actinomycetota bacterium]MBA3561583.1 STAS domain-containing protein [Actinomycetota bacterium]MBA3565418.1 STAS domain-containing protein [Actinomycetota bacterium]